MTLAQWLELKGFGAPWLVEKLGCSRSHAYRLFNRTAEPTMLQAQRILELTRKAVTLPDLSIEKDK